MVYISFEWHMSCHTGPSSFSQFCCRFCIHKTKLENCRIECFSDAKTFDPDLITCTSSFHNNNENRNLKWLLEYYKIRKKASNIFFYSNKQTKKMIINYRSMSVCLCSARRQRKKRRMTQTEQEIKQERY